MSEWSKDAQLVSISYAMWLCMYMACRHVIFRNLSSDGANRAVSVVHAVVGSTLPLLTIDLAALSTNVGSPTTDAQLWVLRLSLGYFLYDMFCCIAIEVTTCGIDVATVFHHVVTIAGLLVGVFQRVSGHELLLCLVLMELSNPCMHVRYILRELKWHDTSFATVNDLAFAVTFLVCRNILGLPVVYWTTVSSRSPLLVKLGGWGVLLVSWFWTQKLLSLILRKLRGCKRERKE